MTVARVAVAPPAPRAEPAPSDALAMQRRANDLTAKALAEARTLLVILTGAWPKNGDSFPPRG